MISKGIMLDGSDELRDPNTLELLGRAFKVDKVWYYIPIDKLKLI